jgi:uncharacterized tellurite resistance protein B-like protein
MSDPHRPDSSSRISNDAEPAFIRDTASRQQGERDTAAAHSDPDDHNNRDTLYHFAYLSVTLAHGADGDLSPLEVDALIDRLHRHYIGWSMDAARAVAYQALSDYRDATDRWAGAQQACHYLAAHLDADERDQALEDLLRVAQADGIVKSGELEFVNQVAVYWHAVGTPVPAQWTSSHDLAYLYLSLALGADGDLGPRERDFIDRRLGEGGDEVLEEARVFYADHHDQQTRDIILRRLRDRWPSADRAHMLRDLVSLANADGRFMDEEEDLINSLLYAWDIDPAQLYKA